MGFDDFFEDKRSHHGNYREQSYHNNYDNHDEHRCSHDSYPAYHGHQAHQKWVAILDRIRSNKKLKIMVIVAGSVLLLITFAIIAALLPVIIKLFNYISQNGLQGVTDGVTGFLDKLWKGSGK